jgi:hypothetical protein
MIGDKGYIEMTQTCRTPKLGFQNSQIMNSYKFASS